MKKRAGKKIKGISAFNYRDVGWIPKINETMEWRYKVELSKVFEDTKCIG